MYLFFTVTLKFSWYLAVVYGSININGFSSCKIKVLLPRVIKLFYSYWFLTINCTLPSPILKFFSLTPISWQSKFLHTQRTLGALEVDGSQLSPHFLLYDRKTSFLMLIKFLCAGICIYFSIFKFCIYVQNKHKFGFGLGINWKIGVLTIDILKLYSTSVNNNSNVFLKK